MTSHPIDPKALDLLNSLESDRPGLISEVVRLFVADAPTQLIHSKRQGMKRYSRRSKLICIALTLASGAAFAQAWPAKPVTVVVTFSPGGSSDIVARLIAGPLQGKLGRQR